MSEEIWGTDLHLIDNLEFQSDREPPRDLKVTERAATGQIDLSTHTGLDNLRQALMLRMLTAAGELAPLGHPNYGSRLYELIGERNTETNRNRAKMYVLQALSQETRIEKILRVEVTTNRADPSRIDIDVTVKIIRSSTPLNLVFPFFLE